MIKKIISIISGLFFCMNLSSANLRIYNNTSSDIALRFFNINKNQKTYLDLIIKKKVVDTVEVDPDYRGLEYFNFLYSKDVKSAEWDRKYKQVSEEIVERTKNLLLHSDDVELTIYTSFFSTKFKVDLGISISGPNNVKISDPDFDFSHAVNFMLLNNEDKIADFRDALLSNYISASKQEGMFDKLMIKLDNLESKNDQLTSFGKLDKNVLNILKIYNKFENTTDQYWIFFVNNAIDILNQPKADIIEESLLLSIIDLAAAKRLMETKGTTIGMFLQNNNPSVYTTILNVLGGYQYPSSIDNFINSSLQKFNWLS